METTMQKTAWGLIRIGLAGIVVPIAMTAGPGFVPAASAQSSPSLEENDVRVFRSLVREQSDVSAIRAWIEEADDINEAEGDGTIALHWASYWNHLEAVRLLIGAGADVNRANDLGVTPLWLVAENGNAAIAESLLDGGADPDRALLAGETPVMTAARANHAGVLELLLSRGADPNTRATRNQTALMWAASQRHPETVEVLLRYGADIDARSDSWRQFWQTINTVHDAHPDQRVWIDEGGYTPLLFAARVGDLESAKLLVAAGATLDDTTAAGRNALILAVQSVIDYRFLPRHYRPGGPGYLSAHAAPDSDGNALVEFLLEKGADPNADNAGFTALHEAMLRRNDRAVRALLGHGADPNARLKVSTPVRRSSSDFFFDATFVGASPFWLAARFGQPEVMRLLVERDADPLFALHVEYWGDGYRYTGFPRVTEGLTTALMAAVGMPQGRGYAYRQPGDPVEQEALALEAAMIAVELGVDINAVNATGWTALDGAMSSGYSSVVMYLESLGARSGASSQRLGRGGP